MDILILGGDKRLKYAARFLNRKHNAYIYEDGLSAGSHRLPYIKSDVLVLGIPCCTSDGFVNTTLHNDRIHISAIPDYVKEGGLLTGGMIIDDLREICSKNNIICKDYYSDETVILKNAVPSCEGALALGINNTESTIYGSSVLITGYGRIGAMLARYLLCLGADVTVAARKREKRVLAEISGCKAVDFNELAPLIGSFQLIYNTVPSIVLDSRLIADTAKGAVYIELASKSGCDEKAAEEKKLTVIKAPGLPAKTAPLSAGRIIADAVSEIADEYMKEREKV